MKLRRTTLIVGIAALGFLFALSGCDIWIVFFGGGDGSADLSFSIEWNGQVDDVDLYLTYPKPTDGDTTNDNGAPTFTLPYFMPATGGDTGFYPEDGATEREKVWASYSESTASVGLLAAAELLANETSGYGPETIVVRGFPFAATSAAVSSTGGGTTGLPAGADYTWVGVMEVYAWGVTDPLSELDGSTASAVLSVYDGSDLIGRYEVPTETLVLGASLVRVNCFYADDGFSQYEYYQIIPDVRVLTSQTQIRGVESAPILTVQGRSLSE